MEKRMANYTILVNSCDSYSDLWEPFFLLLKKYWAGEIPEIVLNTETKDFSMNGLQIHCPHCPDNPKGFYGKRLKYALNTIDTEYVLCLLDDFFIRETVDTARIEQLIDCMDRNQNISCFNFEDPFEGERSVQYPGFVSLPQIAEYKLNMQAAIWRKDDLYKLWKDRVDPWTWETVSNKLTYTSTKEYYFLEKGHRTPVSYGKMPGLTWGVVRGKWMEEDVVPLFEKEGISVDYSARGFFTPEQRKKASASSMIELNLKMLYILGFSYVVRNFCYSTIYRRIKALQGIHVVDYDTHLAQKMNRE